MVPSNPNTKKAVSSTAVVTRIPVYPVQQSGAFGNDRSCLERPKNFRKQLHALRAGIELVDVAGLEPAPSCLQQVLSQLSYTPILDNSIISRRSSNSRTRQRQPEQFSEWKNRGYQGQEQSGFRLAIPQARDGLRRIVSKTSHRC